MRSNEAPAARVPAGRYIAYESSPVIVVWLLEGFVLYADENPSVALVTTFAPLVVE
jgi:hypothetical protein